MNGENTTPLLLDPWRHREQLGLLNALGLTVKQIVTSPSKFFQGIDIRQSCLDPFLFYFIVSVTMGLLRFLVYRPLVLSTAFLGLLISAAATIFLITGFLHLFVWIFKGQGGVKGTFHIVAYASVVSFLSLIPFIGQWLSLICDILLVVIGYKVIHGFKTGKAVLVYVLPFFVIFTAALSFSAFYAYSMRTLFTKNEATATAALSDIRSALDAYAADHNGEFPQHEHQMLEASPPYLPADYRKKVGTDYRLDIELNPASYRITVQPQICNRPGQNIFILEAGREIEQQPCQPLEGED